MTKTVLGQEETRCRVITKLTRELGSKVCGLLEDPAVIEIMLNSDGKLWVERLGSDMEEIGTMSASQAECLMGTLASLKREILTEKNPRLSCELPKEFLGARFQGSIPPVVRAPSFAIRKRAIAVFTLRDYVRKGIMSESQREIIEAAVSNRQNLLIAGGTGSGKTTLTNAVVQHITSICSNDRIITLEDTRELQCTAKNAESMLTTEEVNMTSLLKDTLRYRPDRILVGEVRDGAALDLLMAWNTGHPGGVCTVHSNSAHSALTRMELLVGMAVVGPMQTLIADAVNLIVYIEKCSGSRRIKEIVRVVGYDGQRYLTQQVGE
jgi:type IV secretion system protein VirB11